MTAQGLRRRSSYEPTRPTLGERGLRTRQQLMDAALACFIEHGFHSTSVESIAARAETSRATVYQYFASKDAVFSELMVESGTTLIRITRAMGPLGPTAEGFGHLAVWVRDWVANFDRHAPMFVEWSNVLVPASPLLPEVVRFNNGFTHKVGKQLSAAGQPDGTPEISATLAVALLERFNYLRHVYRPALTDRQFLTSLAVALQLYFFPSTPSSVLGSDPVGPRKPRPEVEPPPVTRLTPVAKLRPRGEARRRDPLDGHSTRARDTAGRILDAGRRVFNANGFSAANIDQVVAEAELARGTFYRYFSSKHELLETLADRCAAEMGPLFTELPSTVDSPAALRGWLARFLQVHRTFSGVMRTWSESRPVEPAVLVPAAEVVVPMRRATNEILGRERRYPFERIAAGMLLSALLEHFPNVRHGTDREPTDEQIVEAQARFIERVIHPPR